MVLTGDLFSEAVGDFFGSVLGFEASMAFALEAGFLGIMIFGWERVPPLMHYFATIMVALGANLSIFWILSANSWLQTPAGGDFIQGHFVVSDYFQAIFNPFMLNSVLHMFFATLETSLFVIGGISAWYILQKRHEEFFSLSLKIVLAVTIAVAPLQLYIGHLSGEQVYHYQPTKLAAMEAQWETIPAGTSPSWSAIALPNDKAERNDWEISIPGLLSLHFRNQTPTIRTSYRTQRIRSRRSSPSDRFSLLCLSSYDCDRLFISWFDGINCFTMAAR